MTAAAVLEVGRELDALVSEKVMGWTDVDWSQGYYAVAVNPITRARQGVYSYSTDISAAWEVVERMIALGFDVDQLSFTPAAIDKQEWQAAFSTKPVKGDRHRMRRLFFEFDPSLPRAICLAALKAVEAL